MYFGMTRGWELQGLAPDDLLARVAGRQGLERWTLGLKGPEPPLSVQESAPSAKDVSDRG